MKNGIKIKLPMSALVVDSGVEPRVGDVVDIQGTARVEMAQDGKARLVIVQINGVEPEDADGDADDAEGDAGESGDDAAMRAEAEKADKEAYL